MLYGVGNAFWQNFTVALPNFVGGMSLGFNSYEEDAPAWGNNAVFPYKEMWVYSSCRMAMNLSRIGIGAQVSGRAQAGALFTHLATGAVHRIRPGRFNRQMPAGEYSARFGDFNRPFSLADGSAVSLDLNPKTTVALHAEAQVNADGHVAIIVHCDGQGKHRLGIRLWNADLLNFDPVIDLSQGTASAQLAVKIRDQTKPWFVHVSADENWNQALEIAGTNRTASARPLG